MAAESDHWPPPWVGRLAWLALGVHLLPGLLGPGACRGPLAFCFRAAQGGQESWRGARRGRRSVHCGPGGPGGPGGGPRPLDETHQPDGVAGCGPQRPIPSTWTHRTRPIWKRGPCRCKLRGVCTGLWRTLHPTLVSLRESPMPRARGSCGPRRPRVESGGQERSGKDPPLDFGRGIAGLQSVHDSSGRVCSTWPRQRQEPDSDARRG